MTLHEDKEVHWVCRKTYICEIESDPEESVICDKRDEYEPMTRQGPDCSNCDVYQDWLDKVNGGKKE